MADYETNPILALWKLLPPEARKSYGSMVNFAAELSPGAAVRDVVDESGNMVKAAQGGNWVDAAAGPAKMAVAALGVIPTFRGARMTTKTAQETLAPIRAYHGSPTHGIPPGELTPSQRGPLGPAVYMTPHEPLARRYAGAEGHVYERDVNPGDIFHGTKMRGAVDVNPYEVWRNQQKRLVDAAEPDKKEAINALFEKMWPDDGYPLFHALTQLHGSQEEAQKLLKKAGFKGISASVDGPEIAWFGKYGLVPATVAAGATGAATVPSLLAPPDDKGAY